MSSQSFQWVNCWVWFVISTLFWRLTAEDYCSQRQTADLKASYVIVGSLYVIMKHKLHFSPRLTQRESAIRGSHSEGRSWANGRMPAPPPPHQHVHYHTQTLRTTALSSKHTCSGAGRPCREPVSSSFVCVARDGLPDSKETERNKWKYVKGLTWVLSDKQSAVNFKLWETLGTPSVCPSQRRYLCHLSSHWPQNLND